MGPRDDSRGGLYQINDGILTMTDFVFGILLGAAGGLAAAVLLPRVYAFGARAIAKVKPKDDAE